MDKDRIKQASDSLYSPSAPSVTHAKKDVDSTYLPSEEIEPVSTKWKEVPVAPPIIKKIDTGKINILLRKGLVGAIIFFAVSLVVSILIYFYGNNIISARNISIEVNAPSSAPSSNPFSFDVSIQNGNNASLVSSDIIIDYPDGAKAVDDDTKPLVSEKIDIGTIKKGEVVKKTAEARLFGQENDIKKIKITFEYKLAGSAGTFSKTSSFDVNLRQAPITVSVEALKEVSNNQEITLVAKIASNSNNLLQNVVLNVDYPFGFAYSQSNLEVETGNIGQFPLGDISPNGTKEIIIKGTITGQSNEDKLFKFNVGTSDTPASSVVATSLVSYSHTMVLRNDFLSSAISFVKGDQIFAGGTIQGSVTWKNTLNVPLNDAQFSLRINSNLVDTKAVTSNNGYFDSGKSTIVWDKTTEPNLTVIAPGATGSFSFFVPVLSYDQAISQRITNPKVDFTLNVKAKRLTDVNVSEDITSSFTRTVPVSSSVGFKDNSLYSSGLIKNSGPLPPQAEHKTTYTAVFSITNSINNISGGQVVATLPVYVSYEGLSVPSSEKVVWNEDQHKLRWDLSALPARTGYGTSPRTLSFKVGLIPSRTQIGQAPILVRDIIFTGQDDFAGTTITVNAEPITTTATDPGFVFGNDRVVQ